jgi:hypothetical protein
MRTRHRSDLSVRRGLGGLREGRFKVAEGGGALGADVGDKLKRVFVLVPRE